MLILPSVCLHTFSCVEVYYLQFLHGELGAVLFGALHQNVQCVTVILPLGTQGLLPDGLLYAFLQYVSSTDTLQTHTVINSGQQLTLIIFTFYDI